VFAAVEICATAKQTLADLKYQNSAFEVTLNSSLLHKKNVWNSKKHVISKLTIVTKWVIDSLITGLTFNIEINKARESSLFLQRVLH